MDVCSCIRAGTIHQYVSIQTWPISCCCRYFVIRIVSHCMYCDTYHIGDSCSVPALSYIDSDKIKV